ncbi:hypothetical protein K2173_022894 [Erythroxylum novogranatense]|uniref:RecA family profile 1 domain-containing protein n=1 Tax=Erythroxylum novogranatense TaxID=1862640 RepID=A0AAV8TXY7_9ROSI|nr:hypothetical protein K2173_022894 [Erythroxylum novogranatense]
MAPLKSLEREYPMLDSDFQSFCASHGISTVEDFLMQDLYVFAALVEQQQNSERLKEGITQVLSIIDGQHQPWKNGIELLEDADKNKGLLPTGVEGIDTILQGGLRRGQLTELVGPSTSGKTQVCLQIASNVAKNQTGSVVYIDTCNSFSPQHIKQFVIQNSFSASDEVRSKTVQKVMSNIFCHSVFNIFAMFDVLRHLENNLRSQMQIVNSMVLLVIIDSLSSLVTPILGGGGAHGRALMTSAGSMLKKLAHEQNIAIMVVNHMVGGEGGNPKPALGETWKSIPHVRLLLSTDRETNVSNVFVIKHPSIT